MDEIFIITATAVNVLSVLQKMASLLTRNRLKMQILNVIETDVDHISQITLSLYANEETIHKFVKQLKKMTDVMEVRLQLPMLDKA